MRIGIDKSKVMRNAWYLKRVVMKARSFGECLRKAWRNEKLRIIQHLAEGLPAEEPKPNRHSENTPAFIAGGIAYYAEARTGQYFGD